MANPWKKGQSGNPKGRPKGDKDKYTKIREAFFQVFHERGQEGLREYAGNDPSSFYKTVTTLLPKEQEINLNAVMKVELISNVDES